MQLWTIQTDSAWRSMQRDGRLRGCRTHVASDMLPAYDWMAAQMRDRIGPPPSTDVSVPIWAWQQCEGIHKKRPDLRSSGLLPKGTRGYRIGFEIPEDLVLLSDFELWHYVLNYWYLPLSRSEAEAFDTRHPDLRCSWRDPPDDPRVDGEIRQSWPRMFDLDWHDPYINVVRDQKSVQATLWQLSHSCVTSVDPFVAR